MLIVGVTQEEIDNLGKVRLWECQTFRGKETGEGLTHATLENLAVRLGHYVKRFRRGNRLLHVSGRYFHMA